MERANLFTLIFLKIITDLHKRLPKTKKNIYVCVLAHIHNIHETCNYSVNLMY